MAGKKSHTNSIAPPDVTFPALGLVAGFLFMLLSIALIPYAGIQEDEALFSVPFYVSGSDAYDLHLFGLNLPLMVMSYVGSLKTLVYWPLVHLFHPNIWLVRLPVALFGAITIFFFYKLVRTCTTVGPAFAAAAASLLLATDPVFLLTNTFDWGPVALEHLLLVGGCYFLFRFSTQTAKTPLLAAGFFFFGLAVWNKALFLWALTGLTVATVTVCWDRLKPCLSLRNLTIAAASFLLGALPFVIYNVARHNATVSENAHLDLDHMPAKWLQLQRAFNGSSLFGYMTGELYDPPLKPPPTWKGRLAESIFRHLGEHRETEFFYVFGGLLLLVPLWWPSRAARFSLAFMAVAWSMMALTKNAGAAAHHDVLLWPFPFLFAATVLAAIPWRWLAIAAAGALIAMNLLVVNQYVFQLERSGATGNFSDALISLENALPDGQTVYIADWGIRTTSELIHQGRLRAQMALGQLQSPDPDPSQRDQLAAMLADSNAIWVSHAPNREAFSGVDANLDRIATSLGYRRETIRTVDDSNGRPYFEIFRFRHG